MADIRKPGMVSRAQPSKPTNPQTAEAQRYTAQANRAQPKPRQPQINPANVANARRTQGNAVMSVSQGVRPPVIAPAQSTDVRNLPGVQGMTARFGYWDNPLRVVRYHNAMQSLPQEQRANIPLDEQGLGAAYNRLAEYNQGKPPEQWSAPVDNGAEPYYEITRAMPEPPQEMRPYYEWARATKENPNPWKQAGMGDLYPLARSEAEQYFTDISGLQTQGDNVLVPAAWLYGDEGTQQTDMTNGIPTSTYDQLKPWQRFLLNATPAGSGAAMGGGQGAIMGLLAGGPAGAVVGGALGGGLGGLFGAAADNPVAQKAISALNILDAPAEGAERAVGLISQLVSSAIDPAQYGPIGEILDNLPEAWQAAHFTENVANIGSLTYDPFTDQTTTYAWEVTNPEPVATTYQRGQSPSALMLAEARKRLIQGESIETIEADLRARVGMAYDVREAIGHMILDPLNVVALGETALVKAGAKLAKNAPLLKAVDTIEDLNRTRNVFNKAGGVDILGEYARNLRTMKPADLARFAPLSRFIAGVDEAGQLIDYATQPRARAAVAKALQHAITLTPQSKANILTYQLAQGLDVMIHDAADVREIEHGVRAVSNLKPGDAVQGLEDAGMMQWFESAEAQPAPGAVKAALPRVEAVIEAYKNVLDKPGQPGPVTILQRAADAASTEGKPLAINDVIRMFGEATSKEDFERIYRGMAETIQANVNAGTVDKAALAEFMQGGYGKYAEMARLFYGEDGIPFTLDQLKARVGAALAQGIEEYSVKYFGVKPRGWGERASNAVKSFQTLTMLNTPTFVANNYLNNILTLSWDGLIGVSTKRGRQGWLRGMGMDVEKMRIGMTAADLGTVGREIDNAKRRPYQMGEEIRKATNANQSAFERKLAEFSNKMSIFPRLGGAIERNASELAYYHAIRPYWDAIWTSGKGFDRMSKEFKTLAGYLDSLQPGTSKKIEQMIGRSKSRTEIEKAIFNGFQTSGIKDALSPDDLEVLNAVPGLVDGIDAALKEAKTPADVRKVFDGAREKVTKQIRTETRKQARVKAERVLTRMSVEGVAGGAAEFDEVIDARASALMQHFDRMQAVADDLNERALVGKERAAVWQRARAEEDAVFRAFEDDEAAKWLGMFQALGSTDNEGAALLALLGEGSPATGTMGLHSNWRRFFTQTADEYANFHALPDDMPKVEKAKAWDDLNTRLLDEYNQAVLEEDRVMERIDDLTAKLYARGKQDSTYAYRDMLNWRLSQRDVRRRMAATMSYYRGGKVPAGMEDWADAALIDKVRAITKGKPLHQIGFSDRQDINTRFYRDIYKPLVAEQAQVGHATQPKAPKPPAAPAQPAPEPQPKPPTQPRQPQQQPLVKTPAPTQQAPRVDQSALWKRIAETKPDMVGVLPDGQFDGTAKLDAIKFMRKNNPGAKVRRFVDITPEAWDQAVRNEQLRAKAAQPLEATQYPQVERRLSENEQLRARIAELEKEVATDEKTGAKSNKAFMAELERRKARGQQTAVGFLDVRGLGLTNKTLGNPVGDAYLAHIVKVAQDNGIDIYRTGGDEFSALGDDIADLDTKLFDVSQQLERSIIYVNGRQYEGAKFHHGVAADQGAADAIALQRLAADPDAERILAKRYALRDTTPNQDTNAPEGLDVRAGEPAPSEGIDPARGPEAGAADAAGAAASNGEPRQPDLIPDLEPETVDALPDDTYLVSDAGEVVDPRDYESAEPARPPAKEAVTGNMRAFVNSSGSSPFEEEAIATARVYKSELDQSRTVKVTTPDGEMTRVWENAPVWYKGHYETLKAEDTAFNQAHAGEIRRDKNKPKSAKRVVKSRKAAQMHGQVSKALEYIILKKNPPRNAPILDQWIGWVRNNIAYAMTNPQENFNPDFAWWVGEKDIVLETLDAQIKAVLDDPAANEDTVFKALGRYGDQIIDEYMLRQSAANFPDEVDTAVLPEVDAQDLEDTALRIADNIDEAEARIDIEEQFTRTKDDFERAVMEAMPDDGDLVIDLVDSLARNFNPEIDSQAFYDRLGWKFGGEYAGEEGLSRSLPERVPDGLTTFTEQGRALMRVYKSTDPTAAAHELIHGITPLMRQADADLLRAELFADMELPDDWHTAVGYVGTGDQLTAMYPQAYERLSNAFSRYLADGMAPTTGLQGLFSRMKNWMLAVYKRIVGGELDVNISPETRRMFDRWVAGEQEAPTPASPAPITPTTLPRDEIKRIKEIVEFSPWVIPLRQYIDYTFSKLSKDVRTAILNNDPGFASWSDIEKQARDWHGAEVARAVSKSETIPPEVLADYPDLRQATPEPAPQIAPEPRAADNLGLPTQENTPSLWDAPTQAGLFTTEDLPLFSGTVMRAQAETFAPKPTGGQGTLFDTREQLPTIEARQAAPAAMPEGGLFGQGQREPWQMTRAEFMISQNQPKFDAIQQALSSGKKLSVGTQYKIIALSNPDQIRMTSKGEFQIPEGKKWVYLTQPQEDSLARQAGFKVPDLGERVFHRDEIRQALESGKQVPAEVLADYPELRQAEPPAPAPVEKPAPQWKYEEYSDYSRMLASRYTRKEIEARLGKAEGARAAANSAKVRASDALSDYGPTQRLAHAGNVNRANYEERNGLQNALEIYDNYPEKTAEGMKAAPAPEAPRAAEPVAIQSIQGWKDFRKRLNAGEINAEQIKAAFQSFQDNREAIRAELSKLTVAELQKNAPRRGNKAELVDSRLNSMENSFALASYSWNPFGESHADAVRRAVNSLTDEQVQEIVAKNKASNDQLVQSLTAPKTLDDFRTFVAYRGEKALTPEQRAAFDELVALERRGTQAAQTEQAATIAPAQTNVTATIKETTKRKDGTPIFVVQMAERVERDVFTDLNAKAKKLNGYYSNFVRADAGFTFSTRENAEQFMKLLQGEEVNRAPQVQERIEIKKNATAEKMRALADKLEADATERENAPRLENTAKRAREGAAAVERAQADAALARTMRNLADAIENGDAVHLDGVTAKTHVEQLDSSLRNAMYIRERQLSSDAQRNNGYYQINRDRPPTAEDIPFATYPYPSIGKSPMNYILEAIKGKKGISNAAKTIERAMRGGDEYGFTLTTSAEIEALETLIDAAKGTKEDYGAKQMREFHLMPYKRLQAIGITSIEELRAALREYLKYKQAPAGGSKVREMERNLLGMKIPGYFPTPRGLADELVMKADIQPGMSVLEPSAGKGNIAEAIREAQPEAKLDVIEWDNGLSAILKEKGFNQVGSDIFTHSGSYDRIVMNPPFEEGADIEHVMKAYDMLKPGGRLVAIMSEGPFYRSDRKADSFRNWLDDRGGISEKNPEGSFLKSERSTGVATRTVTIDKPGRAGGLLFRLSPEAATPAPLDARDLPVGTVDQVSPPPTDGAFLEMLRDRILPMLDRAEGTLANDAARGNKLFDFETLDPEMRKQLRQYMGKVGGQMGDAKLAALRYGKAKRDFALLPYERRYNADTFLQGIMPYEFWYTRSMMNWAVRAMNKPQIIANYLRLQQFFNEQQRRDGFPTRLRKKAFVRLPFLPEWMGEGVYIDPYRQAFPFLQLTGPFEKMYDQDNQARKQAISILQGKIEDGEIDANEGQAAIDSQNGIIWQEALAQAKNDQDADVQNPVDFARMISGFSLPANILYLYLTGRQDEISQLPSTRLVQAATGALGIGGPRGVNLEGGIRKLAGLPEIDRFEDYRVDRMLANMTAMGEINSDEAVRAMIDKEGPAFEEAQRKVSQIGVFQYFGAPMALDFFPEGEQGARDLREKYGRAYEKFAAGDKEALGKFFDQYPEYEARRASWDSDNPEDRLRFFLRSEVWERYNALPSIYKRQVREQLGDTFNDAFLNKETRSYDSIKTETLATWARAIGSDNLPNKTPDTPQIGIKFAPKETADAVTAYNAEADRLFPGIGDFLESFYQMPQEQQDIARRQYPQISAYYSWKNKYLAEHQQIIPWVTSEKSELFGLPQDLQAGVYTYRAQRDELFPGIDQIQEGYFNAEDTKAYMKQYPQLGEYWDWRKAMAAQSPKLAPYILSDAALSKAILEPDPTNMLTQEELAQFSPTTIKHLYAYFYSKEPLRAGPMAELDEIWQGMGRPYGTLKKWINGQVRPSLTGSSY